MAWPSLAPLTHRSAPTTARIPDHVRAPRQSAQADTALCVFRLLDTTLCKKNALSLYSSVVERQSCKLKVLGSIPSGGLFPASLQFCAAVSNAFLPSLCGFQRFRATGSACSSKLRFANWRVNTAQNSAWQARFSKHENLVVPNNDANVALQLANALLACKRPAHLHRPNASK